MAVTVEIEGPDLVVRLTGRDRLWALAREVRTPLAAVASVEVLPRREAVRRPLLRLLGTDVPGVVHAGRYAWFGRSEFWFVRRARRLLVVDCREGARFDKLVLEVDDPDAVAARVSPA